MNKKLLTFTLIWVTLALTACGPQTQEEPKKAFLIDVQNISDFGTTISIEKPGKVGGEQEITVTSQVSARVQNIKYKEGQKVNGWQPVIQLADDIANYNSMVKNAKTMLDNSILTYEQNTNSLDLAVDSAYNSLKQAEKNFFNSQKTAEQSLKQAEQAVENAWLAEGSPTALNIEKIISDIENQITSIKSNFKVQKTQLISLLDDVVHQGDAILGVTDKYKFKNDAFEPYIGIQDAKQRDVSKALLWDLYKIRNTVSQIPTTDITNQELLDNMPLFSSSYETINEFLYEMNETLRNSISSTNFPQTQIDGYIATFNAFKNVSQGQNAAFVAYEASVNAFLGDVVIDSNLSEEDVVNSLAKQQVQIALKNAKEAEKSAQIALESAEIGSDTSIFNAETALKNARLNYDTTSQNKSNQVRLLQNGITQAKIAYEDALTTYNKLSVRSPIQGTIGDILVDEGQEINPGVPLFSVISTKENTIEIFVTSEEHELITIDQKVVVEYNDQIINATVTSISSVASANTLYKVRIKLDKSLDLLGDIATVHIPVKLEKVTLPINSVTALQDGKGFIYLLSGGVEAVKTFVDLGQTRSDRIEITSNLPLNAQIITSDISNYNPEQFEFKMREEETK